MLLRARISAALFAVLLASGCAGAPSPDAAGEGGRDASGPAQETRQDPSPTAPESPASPGPGAEDEAAAPSGDLPPVSESEKAFGARFQPLADQFGLVQYVRARRTPPGNGLVFDYLPEGETLANWSYRGTLRVIRVAETWEQTAEILPRYIEAFRERQPGVNDVTTWDFDEGDVSFVDYVVQNDQGAHHNLAAVWQVLPGHLGIFEVHRFGARFEPWQVDRFREVAQRLGRIDRPPPGSDSGPDPDPSSE